MSEKKPNVDPNSSISSVLILTEKQKKLCDRLDQFYASQKYNVSSPSEMFRGALYAMQPQNRVYNSDWMAQAAHSLREILYPLKDFSKGTEFKTFGITDNVDYHAEKVKWYYGFVSNIAHHKPEEAGKSPLVTKEKRKPEPISDTLFEKVVAGFENILFEILRRQIDVHAEIDVVLQTNNKDVSTVKALIELNADARQYFFYKVDETWYDWLLDNRFLNETKSTEENETSLIISELNYLAKVAKVLPEKCISFIDKIPVLTSKNQLIIVSNLLWITRDLPATQLRQLIPKICDEQWPALHYKQYRMGYDYSRMLESFIIEKDFESVLSLAEVILKIRPSDQSEHQESPFYFTDLSHTKVFKYLIKVDDAHIKSALDLTIRTMVNIHDPEVKTKGLFSKHSPFPLYSVDFFTLKPKDVSRRSSEDVRELAAVLCLLAQRYFTLWCSTDKEKVREIYQLHFEKLPDSHAMWRLRLYIWSLCPDIFSIDLHKALFLIFKVENKSHLLAGAEYMHALKKNFEHFSEKDKRLYIKKVLEKFSRDDKDDPYGGWRLLSCINAHLTENERDQAELAYKEPLREVYNPTPEISEGKGGMVRPKGPVTIKEFEKLPLETIAMKLRNEWSPSSLEEQDVSNDFLRPMNADGLQGLLREDFQNRPSEYIAQAELFFERTKLDPHYTYSFFLAFGEYLRGKNLIKIDWEPFIRLITTIVESASLIQFDFSERKRTRLSGWLSSWDSIHNELANTLNSMLNTNRNNSDFEFAKFRTPLLNCISYLLKQPIPDATITESTTDIKTGEYKTLESDPLMIAINSVHGRAFDALMSFVYHDNKQFHKRAKDKLSNDVKSLYDYFLQKEKTKAGMFQLGRNVPFMYFQNKSWIQTRLPNIFYFMGENKDLGLAAWEGYLSQDVYSKIFTEMKAYYIQAISLQDSDYTKRKYRINLDKGLANHLAISYVYFSEIGLDNELLDTFWKQENLVRHSNFISFVGSSILKNPSLGDLEIEKIKNLWDWAFENIMDSIIMQEFGHWIDNKNKSLEIVWLADHIARTLQITGGALNWDYGLEELFPKLSIEAPEHAVQILRLYFLGDNGITKQEHFFIEDTYIDVFKTLFANPVTKEEARTLVNDLLPQGNRQFWKLKQAIE